MTSLWGCLLVVWLWVLFDALEFLSRSFRLSRVSSEIWTKCWFNVQTRPDVKARSSSGAATSFKKRTIFKLSSRERERERERGGPFLDGLDVRASTSALPMKWFWGRSPAHMDQSSVRKFYLLSYLSHERKYPGRFLYVVINHTLGSEKSTFIYTNLLHLSWPLE